MKPTGATAPVGYLFCGGTVYENLACRARESTESRRDYPRMKIERPQRTRNRAPWRRSFSEFGWPGQPPPHMRPNAVQVPPAGPLPHLRPESGTQGRHGRNREPFYGRPVLLPRVDAGFCSQDAFGGRSRQAEHLACPAHGWVKPPAEILPPVIGVMGATLPSSRPLRSFFLMHSKFLKLSCQSRCGHSDIYFLP